MRDDGLILLGVRHHSPACARLVRTTIAERRPAFVLIEGPADFNPHIDDLRLDHELPIAIFSYYATESSARGSYAPFCAHSPEWQALQTAWRVGAKPLFCDLPSWHPDFGDRDNRYADPSGLYRRYQAAQDRLSKALGAEGPDAAWDALVEQREPEAAATVLAQYFDLIRPDGAADPREVARETFMARYAAWALREAEGQPVVLVCGGWHVGGIRAALASCDGERPETAAPEEGARAGSYLTPFSYARLDSFTGYAAGMPSPAYYAQLYDRGADAAAEWAMGKITARLRGVGLPVSTADLVAWRVNAEALARLRSHTAILRADILDAALLALVKDALARPAAWSERGVVRQGDDDIVVAMLQALSGDKEGRLAPSTRQPPLVTDLETRLREHGLTPEATRKRVDINWRDDESYPRAQLLHQLRVLALPGVVRTAAPRSIDAVDLRETFEIVKHPHWPGAVIEASRWGGEVPMAAAARLRARIDGAKGDMSVLASALSDTLFAGLFAISRDIARDLARSVLAASDLGLLGRVGLTLSKLYRFGDAFGPFVALEIAPICEAVFARALLLCESVNADDDALRAIGAVLALRDLAREGAGLDLDRAAARDAFTRMLTRPETPAALSGAALGYLLALGGLRGPSSLVLSRLRSFRAPPKLGDFLCGLFALARESIRDDVEVLDAIDTLIADWSSEEFLIALPALREAFHWFPPREREALARIILQRAGFTVADADAMAVAWTRQRATIATQSAAITLEEKVARRLARYGLV